MFLVNLEFQEFPKKTFKNQGFSGHLGWDLPFQGTGIEPWIFTASQGASKPGTVLQLPYAEALQCIEEELCGRGV